MSTPSTADRSVPLLALLVACGSLLALALALTLSSAALAGDGSFYLLRIVDRGEVFSTDARFLGNVVRQAPVLLAAQAGVTDTQALSVTLGVGHILLPAAVWCGAIALTRRDRVVFAAVALTAGLCAGTTWLQSAGEYVLALPLTALVAVLLWRRHPWTWLLASVAVAASTILIASYETVTFTGTALALWAGWRAATSSDLVDRCGSACVAAASAAALIFAFSSVGSRRDQSHTQSLLYFVVSLEPWPFYVALLACAAFVTVLVLPLSERTRLAGVTLGVTGAALAIANLAPSPRSAFEVRGGAAIAVLALELFLFAKWVRRRRYVRGRVARSASNDTLSRWYVTCAVAFVVASTLSNVEAVRNWSRSLAAFQAAVDEATGPTPVFEVVPGDRRHAIWPWTSTSLSLIVRHRPESGVLFDPNPRLVPFAPDQARAQLDDAYVWGR